ncbi:hypothetical protein TNCV_4509981 [Trichonephila clavipes]|nr:hypothetical protein TNCV_4509981 [Trichonephila clavipes]
MKQAVKQFFASKDIKYYQRGTFKLFADEAVLTLPILVREGFSLNSFTVFPFFAFALWAVFHYPQPIASPCPGLVTGSRKERINDTVAVNFLHHENPPTCAGVEPATLGAECQRKTNHATQPASSFDHCKIVKDIIVINFHCYIILSA